MIIETGEPWHCSCCNKKNDKPNVWALAHWDLELTHTCTDCGQVINILSGAVEIVTHGEKP